MHYLGGLIPLNDKELTFAQLYIYNPNLTLAH
jgi:hypothetical protein